MKLFNFRQHAPIATTRSQRTRALVAVLALIVAAAPFAALHAQPAPYAQDAQPERAAPAPFDINEDGRAPRPQLPEEEPAAVEPSTTLSPLGEGQTALPVLPVEAKNETERRALTNLLKQNAGAVRELRVVVESDEEWVHSVVDRPIVPLRTIRLDGEIDTKSLTFHLSAAQAARPASLSIAFTNSVLVLPEASRLNIVLNGRQIAQTAIDSPDRTKVIALPIPASLLRAGTNLLRIDAQMRHRIDCSIDATYELWTRIDTRLTGFTFPGEPARLSSLTDLPAVGVGTNGATRIRVLQTDPARRAKVDRLLSAAQATAVRGRFVQPLVEAVPLQSVPLAEPGTVNVVIGTRAELANAGVSLRPEASGPAAYLADRAGEGPTVVITGPSERAVDIALERFTAVPPMAPARDGLADAPPWLVKESVHVDGADTVTLQDAGLETLNFSGRRFATAFNVTLPADFYAAAYGEATLYLDAAYAPDVEPGSRIAVYVNGELSTSFSFVSSAGEVFEAFPISLLMRSFHPGENRIEIVAELETEADEACLPGGTVPQNDRFALFSSTRLSFPEFARVGQLPNLASFAANAFPYGLEDGAVNVRVASASLETVGAAGTLLSKLAVSHGAPIETTVVEALTPSAPTIVVASIGEASALSLDATGLSGLIPPGWLQPIPVENGGREPDGLERYDAILQRLRQELRQQDAQLDRTASQAETAADTDPAAGAAPARDSARERWFDNLREDRSLPTIVSDTLRDLREALGALPFIGRSSERLADATPIPDGATLLIAQAKAPQDARTAWTIVTAPTPQLLSTSLAAISAPDVWRRIGGRITAFDVDDNWVETIAAERVSYLATLPLSFTNLRLIAANWFSINNGLYVVALIAVALLLGVLTYVVVSPMGRKS